MSPRSLCHARLSRSPALTPGGCGRGPTTDMWPIRTFANCGVSSRLVRRRNAPNRVTRLSLRRVNTISPGGAVEVNIVRSLKQSNSDCPSYSASVGKSPGPAIPA